MIKPRDRSGSAYCKDCGVHAVHERGIGSPLVIRHKADCRDSRVKSRDIGFTGSGKVAPTPKQLVWLMDRMAILKSEGYGRLHHGDCINGDAAAHMCARELGFWIIVHPPLNSKARAWCEGNDIRAPKPYRARDLDIVNESVRMLALPWLPEKHGSSLRSGTWLTIRLALKANVPVEMMLRE